MNNKSPYEMSLEELFERERNREPLTDEEMEDQIAYISLSELRLAGDSTVTEQDVRATIQQVKATLGNG